jgi:hypothetical protein
MRLSKQNTELANVLRQYIQQHTETVSDGEGVAIVLLWSFFMDHARVQGLDVTTLAREQIDQFIKHVGDDGMELVKEGSSSTH